MIIALFPNTRQAIKAEQICQQQGINTRIRPVPESISTQCGFCIDIEEEDLPLAQEILEENHINVQWHLF